MNTSSEKNSFLTKQQIYSETHALKAIVHFIPIGIFQVDENDKYIFVNPAWESIVGRSLTTALRTDWWEVIHPDDQNRVIQSWAQAEKEEKELSTECRIIANNDEIRWVRLQTTFLFDDTGKSVFGSIQNITENKIAEAEKEKIIDELTELKEQLEVTSRTDPLTSLLNRRGMEEKLDLEMDRMERSGKPFSLALCDIDYFKSINDNYGHDAGDHILSQFAYDLTTYLRKQDTVCRWGGEEFLLMLPETDLAGASLLAEKIRSHIEKKAYTFNGIDIKATLSIGIASMQNIKEIKDCINLADKRLYLAKQGGRNRVVSKSG